MKINDVILQMVSKVVVFIILTFSIYLFLAGHHHPGGGFVGGLMTSSALILLYLAFDLETMKRVIPIDFKIIIGLGLFIAVMTGTGALFFGVQFLTHNFGYFNLPIFGKTELATAVLFDLGVYLTVVGITMTIILEIGDDVE